MAKKEIYLTQRQEERLKQLANSTGLSEAEIIRRAIDRYTANFPPNLMAWQAEKEFLEKWISRGPVSGGRTWTRDEIHER